MLNTNRWAGYVIRAFLNGFPQYIQYTTEKWEWCTHVAIATQFETLDEAKDFIKFNDLYDVDIVFVVIEVTVVTYQKVVEP